MTTPGTRGATGPGAPVAADPLRPVLAAALGAQYELLHLLGRGGMGAVYLAREQLLDRLVAVKALPGEAAASPESRERFLREARTAARLTHPHIVPLHGFGQADDTLFYVMGYVEGESLEARLQREGALAPDEAARILAELADALDHAHKQGVVHRDVKPDNVLLERETGRAMLTDFGIAKQQAGAGAGESLTRTGVIVGTPHYMSPEQASGDREIDGRSDLYALGVIGYRMLAGRLPFAGGSLREILVQHAVDEPPPLTGVAPEVPPALASAVMRALAKDPADRWRTGGELRAALTPSEGDDDETLPPELHPEVGMGVRILAIDLLGIELFLLMAAASIIPRDVLPTILALAPLWLALGYVRLAQLARREGLSRSLALWYRQPRWWTGPWPRVGRRAGDVWDRLPAVVRQQRTFTTCFAAFGVVAFNVVTLAALAGETGATMAAIISVLIATPLVLVVGVVGMVRAWRWSRAHGLTQREMARLNGTPTTPSPFWRRPEIAALLAPAATTARTPDRPRTPDDQLRAIEELARRRRDRDDPIATEAVQAARALASAVAACDRELAQLARDASPAERARVEASLSALGPAAADESDAKRRMRQLVEDQLALVRALEARHAALLARRGHLAGHLQALWLQLANLQAQAALDAADASEITARIRALCGDVDRQLAAMAEVRTMTAE